MQLRIGMATLLTLGVGICWDWDALGVHVACLLASTSTLSNAQRKCETSGFMQKITESGSGQRCVKPGVSGLDGSWGMEG